MNLLSLLAQNYLTRGFWGDEAWTALISQLSISDIIRVTGEDFHPPLYYFMVHFWGGAFGFGEISIRLISLIFFFLTPVVTYFLAQSFFKDKAKSLAISLLVLTSPILFTYAFEARSYAVLAFLTVSSALAFWKARTEKGNKWKIIYMVLGALSVYTHYYSWFILASHGFFLAFFERDKIKKLLAPALGILAIQAPWIPTLFSQVGEVNRSYWIAPINSRTHWEFFLRVSGGDHVTDYQLLVTRIIMVAVAVSLVSLVLKFKAKRKKFPTKPAYLFLLTWLLIPTLIPSLISLQIPIFFYRYLIFSSIPLLILVVDGVWKLPKKLRYLAVLAVLIPYLLINYSSFGRYPRTMREEAAQVYQTKVAGEEPIYTVLPSFAEVMYYVADKDEVIVLPRGLVQFSGKSLLDAYVRNGLTTISEPEPGTGYWLLEPGPNSDFVTSEQ